MAYANQINSRKKSLLFNFVEIVVHWSAKKNSVCYATTRVNPWYSPNHKTKINSDTCSRHPEKAP